MIKHYFIINPSAGKGNKVEKLLGELRATCEASELDYVIYVTETPGDAEKYAKKVCLANNDPETTVRVYACGGDGTINECANGIVGFPNAELGAIPIGTGNDFVRNFGGSEAFFNISAQLKGHAQPCDLIKYNDRYCINMINIGYDSAVVVRTARIKKNPLIPGGLAYVFGLVGELIKKSGVTFRCQMDGKDMGEKKLLLSFFANGGYCGGGFFSAPKAELCDGLMDICLIRYISRLRFLSLVGKYKKGTYLGIKDHEDIFAYEKCREVTLSFREPVCMSVDGEIETCDRLTLSMTPGAIRFVVPEGASNPLADKADCVCVG